MPSGMASIYRRMLTFEGCSFGERTKRGVFISFGAKETHQRKPSPHQGLPSRGGCNRSSCRSYTKVSSDHPLGSAAYMSEASLKKGPAWVLSTTLNAGRLYERRLGPSARSLIASIVEELPIVIWPLVGFKKWHYTKNAHLHDRRRAFYICSLFRSGSCLESFRWYRWGHYRRRC